MCIRDRAVADVKRIIRGVRADAAADAAKAAMAASTAREAEVLLRRRLRAELG